MLEAHEIYEIDELNVIGISTKLKLEYNFATSKFCVLLDKTKQFSIYLAQIHNKK